MVCGRPPASAIRFSLLFAKNAIERPSGDQNGWCPPSLPSMRRLSTSANRRTHSRLLPSAEIATKTRRVPSGDTAISAVPRGNVAPPGG
jgi:hypothetical protein